MFRKNGRIMWISFLVILLAEVYGSNVQYPQGYYPFQESPARIPPVVRKPPYLQTKLKCPGIEGTKNEQTLDNLCGDLNKGYLPVNPTGQNILGVSYPFELVKNKTLEFFSQTLPVLKADDTLPKVAKYQDSHILYNPAIFNSQPSFSGNYFQERLKREVDTQEKTDRKKIEKSKRRVIIESEEEPDDQNDANEDIELQEIAGLPRQSRDGWCDDSFGVFCMLFNVLKGQKQDTADDRIGDSDIRNDISLNSLDEPMTPCPSAVEYVTPVFAKNYQGVWRYVVQIPYEGYFTQTVEVVKCLSTKCEFLEGSCLASPRWVSLLVAEIYYPDAYFPSGEKPITGRQPVAGGPPQDFSSYLQKRSGENINHSSPQNCDGFDELGCFHVRLYYDWFLIPGSCKCWKNDFFSQYTNK